MAFCLTIEAKNRFKKALRDGEINPASLASLSSLERRAIIEGFVGKENAQQVNALFESKLLLKNQVTGMKNWVKTVSGLNSRAKMDLISKIERMDKILSPEDGERFLQDLASTKLKVGVTEEEAKKISEMAKNVQELESKTDKTKSNIPLGRAKLDLIDYVNKLGGKKADFLTNIAGVPRTVTTSFDLSALLNQGWGMISRKEFYKNVVNMLRYAINKSAYRDLQADLITRPNHDLAVKAGLRLTELGNKLELREEQFMSSLLDKFPGISASQRAYTGFLNKLRMDVFDDLIKKAEVAGEDIAVGSKAAEDIAKTVNNFTGGARVGKIEGAVPLLNSTFFSPRKIASTINIMNPINYISPKISKTARLAATRNLFGSLAISASIIALYGLLTGKKQESDPTSSDFGKIRSGDTRLDLSGGNATYLNLLSRLVMQRIKGQGGVYRKLGSGYGETSGFDLMAQFLRYKLSPVTSFFVDAFSKENAIGEKKTVFESAVDRFKPMFIDSVVELLKSDTTGKFGFVLASLFGAGLNTYSQTTDWSESDSKEIKQFRSKVGNEVFRKANDEYNKMYDEWINKQTSTEEYKKLSDEAKKKLITGAKDNFKQKIFKKYNFKYKPEKTQEVKKENETVKSILKKTTSVFKVGTAKAAEVPEEFLEKQGLKVKYDFDQFNNNGKALKKVSEPSDRIKELLHRYYDGDESRAAIVAFTESGYDPKAINTNKNGTKDYGLFQINEETFKDLMRWSPRFLKSRGINTVQDLLEPEKNVATAYLLSMMEKKTKKPAWSRWQGWKDQKFDFRNN